MTVRVFQQENTTKLRQHHASDTPSVKREPERAHTRHTTSKLRHFVRIVISNLLKKNPESCSSSLAYIVY